MVSFLKKIFGKVEQAGVQASEQAKSQTQNVASTASGAADNAQSRLGGARDMASSAASNAQQQAPGARDQAATAAGGAGVGDLLSSVEGLFSGGMPNASEIEAAVSKLPAGELSNILTNALHQVPADSRNQIGQLVNEQSPAGAPAPSSGVASGNPSDLANALSGILKGGGVGALAGLFTAGSPAGASGLQGAASGGSGLNLGALLQNPLARQLLSAILPAIMKASGK